MFFSRKNKKKKPETSPDGSVWSFPFFLASVGNYALCFLVYALFITSSVRVELYKESQIAFFAGFFLMAPLVLTTQMRKIRTIVHEFKHAFVVILTGNKLKKIVANRDDGYVEYQMYKHTLHFAPIISLAPYFFPLFSAPVLFCVMLIEHTSLVIASLVLGAALSADICLGIGEIDPSQQDFRSMFGGYWLSKFYIVGFYLFWPALVYLWVRVGSANLLDGIVELAHIILHVYSEGS